MLPFANLGKVNFLCKSFPPDRDFHELCLVFSPFLPKFALENMDEIIGFLNSINNENSLYVIGGLGVLMLVIQLYFILFIHGKLALLKVTNEIVQQDLPPVSVIIWTRNEEDLLKQNLESILNQDYPDFEVVVVNDRSEDDSKWYLQELSAKYKRLHVTEIADHVLSRQGKKFGVAIGIKAAKHQHLVFTNADCRPASDQWLRHFGGGFLDQSTEIILGYAPITKKKGLGNAFSRLLHYFRSINYLAFAVAGKPFSGAGQNLAFNKDLFFKGKGFASHIHVTSGYDELFVNQHATSHNTRVVVSPEAHVWQPSPKDAKDRKTRRNQDSAVFHQYKSVHKFMLNMQALTWLLWYVLLIVFILLFPQLWEWAVGVYVFRMLMAYLVYFPIARKLRITKMLWFFPILDLWLSLKLSGQLIFAKNRKYGST